MSIIALVLSLALSQRGPAPSRCETVGPRLDGTYVTVCAGRVARVTDRAPAGSFTFLRPSSR